MIGPDNLFSFCFDWWKLWYRVSCPQQSYQDNHVYSFDWWNVSNSQLSMTVIPGWSCVWVLLILSKPLLDILSHVLTRAWKEAPSHRVLISFLLYSLFFHLSLKVWWPVLTSPIPASSLWLSSPRRGTAVPSEFSSAITLPVLEYLNGGWA